MRCVKYFYPEYLLREATFSNLLSTEMLNVDSCLLVRIVFPHPTNDTRQICNRRRTQQSFAVQNLNRYPEILKQTIIKFFLFLVYFNILITFKINITDAGIACRAPKP